MASEVRERSHRQPRGARREASSGPSWLRPARAGLGAGLLALAWAAIMGTFWLWSVTLAIPPHRHAIVRTALYVLGLLGTCWLGVTALAALLTGAFLLMLALTTRGW